MRRVIKFLIVCSYVFMQVQCYSQTVFSTSYISEQNAGDFIPGEKSPAELVQKLTARCVTDYQKLDAIFSWVTTNIEYKTRSYYKGKTSVYDEGEDTGSLRPLYERVAVNVLRSRTAVCDGYAQLIKCLCNYAGIKCEVVTGYGRTNTGSGQFRANHKWNAVEINGRWYLLDATWASGFLNFSGTEFIKSYNGYYFLTPPESFIRDHYPEDLKWSLLDHAPIVPEFNKSPFKSSSFLKYRITSFYPSKGVINASPGDTITIRITLDEPGTKLLVSDNPYIDTTVLFITRSTGIFLPACSVYGNTVEYAYIVNNPAAEWLQVMYNNEVILRYKLNIQGLVKR